MKIRLIILCLIWGLVGLDSYFFEFKFDENLIFSSMGVTKEAICDSHRSGQHLQYRAKYNEDDDFKVRTFYLPSSSYICSKELESEFVDGKIQTTFYGNVHLGVFINGIEILDVDEQIKILKGAEGFDGFIVFLAIVFSILLLRRSRNL